MSACLAIKVVFIALLPVWAWLLVHTYRGPDTQGGFMFVLVSIAASIIGFAALGAVTCLGLACR